MVRKLLQFNYGNTIIIFVKHKKTYVMCIYRPNSAHHVRWFSAWLPADESAHFQVSVIIIPRFN